MKTRNLFVAKLIAVTMMLGLFSPSITIENIEAPSKIISEEKIDLPQGFIISISLFTQAEARRGRGMARRGGRRAGRRAGRRSGRRANFRHGGGYRGGYRGGYYGRGYGAPILGGVVAGAIVGGAVSSAVYSSDCRIVYIDGLRYRDCGNSLVRY